MTLRREIDALCEEYLERYCALDPVAATFIGVTGHDHVLTDLSPDGFEARETLTLEAYRAVEAATPVDDREAVAREAFLERLGLEVEIADAGLSRCQLSVIESGLHDARMVFDMMPTDTDEEWERIASRLTALEASLAGYRITLAEEAAAGRVVARRQYDEVATQVRNWTGQEGESGDLYAALAARAPEPLRERVAAAAESASRAIREFGEFLSAELAPLGRESEAVGRERYALESRRFLGAAIDLDQTYAWGWQELKRLADDMTATADRILPGATLAEAIAHLDADPDRRITGKEEFRDWMQQLADRAVAEMADTHFDIPEPVRRIECCISPANDGGIYYTPPTEDFSRPGRMWWSVPDGVTEFSPWREVTTVYHEGVPGHHLQVGQTVYRQDQLNRWQRLMCWVSGHGEGWALYAERLMDELGFLNDPADRLGMLDAQSFRAARVIIDIGMHLELEIPVDNAFGFHPGETWTPPLGREFMGEHCSMAPEFLDFEVKRYLGWPGQAPSYKVGERIWLQARADAAARHGDEFDLRAFHRAALDLGSIGLDPLSRALGQL